MMNGLKYKLDDLLDELEHCCICQHSEITDDIRAKIHKLMENNIPQWHRLTFRPTTLEEKEFDPDWEEVVENLPDFDKDVLVTNGISVWVDRFDVDDFLYLSESGYEVDGVVAWMEIPSFKEEQK